MTLDSEQIHGGKNHGDRERTAHPSWGRPGHPPSRLLPGGRRPLLAAVALVARGVPETLTARLVG